MRKVPSGLGRWEFLRFYRRAGQDTSQVRLLHEFAKIHATFDDPHLVSQAGLVPVMALAQQAGLADLAAEYVRIARPCGVNAGLKAACLVAGMAAGADSIDDMGLMKGSLIIPNTYCFTPATARPGKNSRSFSQLTSPAGNHGKR